jgi:transposase-like protein
MLISLQGAHFAEEIMLACVRRYVAYPLRERPLEKLPQKREA